MMTVISSLWRWTLMLAVVLAIGPMAWAQQGPPHLGYVYPAGGRQGETFQVKIGGQYLDGVTNVYVSGDGVGTRVVEFVKPLTNKQAMDLREKLQELMKGKKDAAVLAQIAEIRKKLATFNRNANPVIAEVLTLEITTAPNAEPGPRELRVGTALGLSNPLVFCVDRLSEFREKDPQGSSAEGDVIITLPAIVNGRIIPGDGNLTRFPPRAGQPFVPGDVDRYRFEARRGQQLVIVASARELIPYLADAVPGWFQAVVALYDVQGKELAYDDDYRFHPDPVLHYVIPQDGDYYIEIKDAIYRGREDFVYRITIGALPFVTSIFPLGGPAGVQTSVDLRGWNLPVDKLTIDMQGKDAGVYPLSVSKGDLASNHVLFAVDTLPERLEEEANDASASAQEVRLPIIINGRIDRGGDWDVFRFEARAGAPIVAEVCARRLDSPLDSVLKLTDAAGRQVAFSDDHEDKGSGLDTHHADSRILAPVMTDGTYYLHLGDAQHKGGAEYAYRLRISPPRPDFELRVCPSAINAGAGQTIPISIYALRKDGFSGDITLSLKGVPRTFVLSGGVVPADQDRVQATLTLGPMVRSEPLSLRLEGRATIRGQTVVRAAVPADDMMQAFAYRHLVPAQDLKVTTVKRAAVRTPAAILSQLPVKIPLGGTAQVRVAVPAGRFLEKIRFELSEPPEGITVQEVSSGPGGPTSPTDVVLRSDAARTKPGLRGNLIVQVSGERTPGAGATKAKTSRQRVPLGVLPAIPFEIVKP